MGREAAFAISFKNPDPKGPRYPVIHVQRDMELVRRYVQSVLREENVTAEDITITDADSEVPNVFSLCFRGVEIASVVEAEYDFVSKGNIQVTNLCIETEQPHPFGYDTSDDVGRAMASAQRILEEHSSAKVSGQEWFQSLIDHATKTQDLDLFMIIDSVPEDFRKVGDTHVIVPNADNATDDMLEASRNLLMYTDTFGTLDSEYIKKSMSRRKWTRDNFPEWFNEYRGHLTKDARARLAYSLTLSAYTNPPVPAEKYFPEVNAREVRFVPSKHGCKLTIVHDGHVLDITREFESWRDHVKHGELFDLQINRHQLPEYWRKLFKKNAIEVSGVIQKDNADGEISLEKARVHLGLKNEYAGTVTHTFEKSVKIPKGF